MSLLIKVILGIVVSIYSNFSLSISIPIISFFGNISDALLIKLPIPQVGSIIISGLTCKSFFK